MEGNEWLEECEEKNNSLASNPLGVEQGGTIYSATDSRMRGLLERNGAAHVVKKKALSSLSCEKCNLLIFWF